ncbi:hypothetical protein L596_015868 [Steinernema carpocapsae]|uniref:Uncharacterized protein n=1 Tax=Steinernema carpocapsae TaxID=34508 RepID=A0A4V6A375_STECR|nr:hypothetical protein L596_015868 [Steinernema carpocapsae]
MPRSSIDLDQIERETLNATSIDEIRSLQTAVLGNLRQLTEYTKKKVKEVARMRVDQAEKMLRILKAKRTRAREELKRVDGQRKEELEEARNLQKAVVKLALEAVGRCPEEQSPGNSRTYGVREDRLLKWETVRGVEDALTRLECAEIDIPEDKEKAMDRLRKFALRNGKLKEASLSSFVDGQEE